MPVVLWNVVVGYFLYLVGTPSLAPHNLQRNDLRLPRHHGVVPGTVVLNPQPDAGGLPAGMAASGNLEGRGYSLPLYCKRQAECLFVSGTESRGGVVADYPGADGAAVAQPIAVGAPVPSPATTPTTPTTLTGSLGSVRSRWSSRLIRLRVALLSLALRATDVGSVGTVSQWLLRITVQGHQRRWDSEGRRGVSGVGKGMGQKQRLKYLLPHRTTYSNGPYGGAVMIRYLRGWIIHTLRENGTLHRVDYNLNPCGAEPKYRSQATMGPNRFSR